MRDYLEANGVKKAVVIGGGFIGLELAENLFDGVFPSPWWKWPPKSSPACWMGRWPATSSATCSRRVSGAHRHQGHGPCGRWQGGGRTDRRRSAALRRGGGVRGHPAQHRLFGGHRHPDGKGRHCGGRMSRHQRGGHLRRRGLRFGEEPPHRQGTVLPMGPPANLEGRTLARTSTGKTRRTPACWAPAW